MTAGRPDGSNNNFVLPHVGKSNSPYSRNVPPVQPKPPNLPDPSVVFDQLMRVRPFPLRSIPYQVLIISSVSACSSHLPWYQICLDPH